MYAYTGRFGIGFDYFSSRLSCVTEQFPARRRNRSSIARHFFSRADISFVSFGRLYFRIANATFAFIVRVRGVVWGCRAYYFVPVFFARPIGERRVYTHEYTSRTRLKFGATRPLEKLRKIPEIIVYTRVYGDNIPV